jgi:hypothetical protein
MLPLRASVYFSSRGNRGWPLLSRNGPDWTILFWFLNFFSAEAIFPCMFCWVFREEIWTKKIVVCSFMQGTRTRCGGLSMFEWCRRLSNLYNRPSTLARCRGFRPVYGLTITLPRGWGFSNIYNSPITFPHFILLFYLTWCVVCLIVHIHRKIIL